MISPFQIYEDSLKILFFAFCALPYWLTPPERWFDADLENCWKRQICKTENFNLKNWSSPFWRSNDQIGLHLLISMCVVVWAGYNWFFTRKPTWSKRVLDKSRTKAGMKKHHCHLCHIVKIFLHNTKVPELQLPKGTMRGWGLTYRSSKKLGTSSSER